MSMHPSLKIDSKSTQHRSVLKRLEKLLHFLKKDEWKEGDSVFGFPKVKIVKFKVKKEKTKDAEEAAAGATDAAAATPEGAAPSPKDAQAGAGEKEAPKK